MKRALALTLLCLAAPALASDREAFADGVRLLRAGQPKEALNRLRAAEKSFEKDELPASLLADLAVAAWQAGELGDAESYAERAAARDGDLDFLRDTIVGGVRLEEARKGAQDPQGLAAAKEKAERAVAAFEHALGRRDSEEARRNLERALKVLAEIEEKLKQQEQQKKDEEQKQDDKDKKDKKDEQQKQQDQQKPDEKPDEKKGEQGEEKKPEQEQPQPEPKEQEQPKPGDKQDEKQQDAQKDDQQQAQAGDQKPEGKPGKDDKPRLVSPEEAARLQRLLEQIEKDKKELRLKLQPRHTPGKKDW